MVITQYVPSERGCDLSKLPLSSRAYILFGGERVLQHLQQRIRVDATGARLTVRSHTVVEQTEGPMAVFQSTQIFAPRTPFPSSPVYPLSFSLSLSLTHFLSLVRRHTDDDSKRGRFSGGEPFGDESKDDAASR